MYSRAIFSILLTRRGKNLLPGQPCFVSWPSSWGVAVFRFYSSLFFLFSNSLPFSALLACLEWTVCKEKKYRYVKMYGTWYCRISRICTHRIYEARYHYSAIRKRADSCVVYLWACSAMIIVIRQTETVFKTWILPADQTMHLSFLCRGK